MRVRSAQSLVFAREGREIVAYNFLTGATFNCSPDLLALLSELDTWADLDKVARLVPGMSADELASTLNDLIAVDALTVEGSEGARAEDDLRTTWRWGMPAAMFHFSLRDRSYLSIEEGEKIQEARATDTPQPPLFLANPCADAIKLPPSLADNELLQLMARRRTVRAPAPRPVPLSALSDCLFAGMGITSGTRNCVGTLPLSMTPSGGARNPYEAYVYARTVEGLAPGFYHYAAIDHTLAPVSDDDLPLPSELLGGQAWTDDMPCVVFLCAQFERTMWKYDDANAYRVVLIEAGHVGQNVMLAATRRGLTACPTAALNHSRINQCIGEQGVTRSPIYALTIAYPEQQAAAEVGFGIPLSEPMLAWSERREILNAPVEHRA